MNNNHKLSNTEYSLYAQHLVLENIGLAGQEKLKQTKVLIIGLGGLGCPCSIYLTTSGIGCIGIIDDDTINISNLNRQILYYYKDIQKDKTSCTKDRISKLNPWCKIIIHAYKLQHHNMIEIIKHYDIIIDACDNFETRYLVDQACYKLHKIHIYGGIYQYEGQISVFNYNSSSRYSHLYPKTLRLANNKCNNNGILGVIAGTIGILQATETLKIILGIGNIITSSLLKYNLLDNSISKIHLYEIYENNQKYYNSKDKVSKTWITEDQLQYMAKYEPIVLIDIREQIEFTRKHMHKAINIPINRLEQFKSMLFLQLYHERKKLIIYCINNYRALIASYILNQYHIQHFILIIK